ncbi:DNA-3-methyladenine glycosylase [Anaerosphaera multitolerans]|uniref:Putative 3-methyladenine DNA glycosylase n=1 Tax=Anaerosphaera multitolerans TaxID=2487351 RepID=A0A437S533_9FIRM|nr:DNA-3-methyladenine glycosylase [Anaerosphaera multitolerans]RVU54104.1 DNA-3-methyladenine glycosylase [Anaerosphaera multitolerans]
MKLSRDFYERDTVNVAEDLLGKLIIRETEKIRLVARIVEVEAYTGYWDKACHTYRGKRTSRTEIMYGSAGHLYIYLNYGIYNLINIVSNKKDLGEAVLIRGIEPVVGIDEMARNRYGLKYEELNSYKRKNLSNGPGKLSMALNIDRSYNGEDVCSSQIVYLEDDGFKDFKTVRSKRIGIDYAEEARDFPYRFYIEGNDHVSVK